LWKSQYGQTCGQNGTWRYAERGRDTSRGYVVTGAIVGGHATAAPSGRSGRLTP